MIAKDPFNLQRFVDAQAAIFESVIAELREGYKRSHWMWFVFPQIQGLGHSRTAAAFAISSKYEAAAYLQHPLLGPRLRECTRLVTLIEKRPLREIFGSPDDLKFRSSMRLFAHASDDNQVFIDALKKYCASEFDPATLERL